MDNNLRIWKLYFSLCSSFYLTTRKLTRLPCQQNYFGLYITCQKSWEKVTIRMNAIAVTGSNGIN
jgi:hypothetical protein